MFVLYYVVMARDMVITSINHLYFSKDRRINTTKGDQHTSNPTHAFDSMRLVIAIKKVRRSLLCDY